MATPAQIEANRKNAKKSTGPKTPAGKLIAARNAATHGLTANHVIIDNEDRTEFNTLSAKMLIDLAPAGPVEQMLAERIIALTWRIKRAEWMESGVLNVLSNKGDVVARIDAQQQHRIRPSQLRDLSDTMNAALHTNRPKKFSAAVDKLAALLSPNVDAPTNTVLGCIAIEDFRESNILERLLRYQGQIERRLYKAILELRKIQAVRKTNEAIPPAAQTQKKRNEAIFKLNEIAMNAFLNNTNDTNDDSPATNDQISNPIEPNPKPISAPSTPYSRKAFPARNRRFSFDKIKNPLF